MSAAEVTLVAAARGAGDALAPAAAVHAPRLVAAPLVAAPQVAAPQVAAPQVTAPLVAARPVLLIGWAGALAALLLTALLAALPADTALALAAGVAVGLLALGTPHGALDHLTLARRQAESLAPALVADRTALRLGTAGLGFRFVAGYLGCAGLALTGYLVAPTAGFAAFLALSIAHFALGEAGVAVERGLARSWRDPLAWAAAVGGLVIVVLPLATPAAGSAVAAVDPRLTAVLAPLPALAVATVAVVGLALLTCAVVAVRDGRRRAAAVVAGELALLVALAALAHPLVAFAAYFGTWHALRHQARLATDLERQLAERAPGDLATPPHPAPQHPGLPHTRRRPLRLVARSAVAGLPASAVVLVAGVALALTGQSLLGALLAVVWALTVPHALAVAGFEWRRRRDAAAAPPLP